MAVSFSKKGIIGEFIVKFWSSILLVTVLFGAYLLFKTASPGAVTISSAEGSQNIDTVILALLRSPLSATAQPYGDNFGDLLMRYSIEPDNPALRVLVEEELKLFFSPFHTLHYRLLVSVRDDAQKQRIESFTGTRSRPQLALDKEFVLLKGLGRSCTFIATPYLDSQKIELVMMNMDYLHLGTTSQRSLNRVAPEGFEDNALKQFSC